MESQFIYSDTRDHIALLQIKKEQSLNALNETLLKDLEVNIDIIEKNNDIRIVILTGVGKSFVAGADIKQMYSMTKDEAERFSNLGQRVFSKIEKSDKIYIAAVNGYAIGGGMELAMACDMRIAVEKATFSQPELHLGIIPGFGATQRLPKLIGVTKAKELIFTGKKISASEALQIGLVNEITAQDNLLNRCYDIAEQLLHQSYFALVKSKYAINEGLNLSVEKGCEIEKVCFADCFTNSQQKEGMKAFIEKRNPNF